MQNIGLMAQKAEEYRSHPTTFELSVACTIPVSAGNKVLMSFECEARDIIAGGSAPKHVDQFLAEGHLRWDSLGEFLALAESLRFLGQKYSDDKLEALTVALDSANDAYLENNKAPGRKVGQPDNKASHFFVT